MPVPLDKALPQMSEQLELALVGVASYPVLVHRLTVSVHPSSPRLVASPQLGFASLAVDSSREDFHLQVNAHAGRTENEPGGSLRPALVF